MFPFFGKKVIMYFLKGNKMNKNKIREKEYNTRDSNVVPHRSTNRARTCLTSLSRREAVLSCWYGRIRQPGQIFRYINCICLGSGTSGFLCTAHKFYHQPSLYQTSLGLYSTAALFFGRYCTVNQHR